MTYIQPPPPAAPEPSGESRPSFVQPPAAAQVPPTPAAPLPPSPPPAPASKASGLAITAFVVGIVAFVFGLVPGLGIVLAVGGLVLGIIALVRRLPPKWAGILAVVLSGIALLTGVIVTSIGAAFVNAVQDGVEDTQPGADDPADAPDGADAAPEQPAAPVADGSSLSAPLPFGTTVSVDGWAGKFDVSFGQINWDATAVIDAENPFNSDPAAGMKYIMIPVTVTNTDDEAWNAQATVFWADVKLVSNGRGFSEGTIVVTPNGLSDQGDLYPGGTATGNVVFEVPADVTDGVWDVDGTFVSAQ